MDGWDLAAENPSTSVPGHRRVFLACLYLCSSLSKLLCLQYQIDRLEESENKIAFLDVVRILPYSLAQLSLVLRVPRDVLVVRLRHAFQAASLCLPC